MWSSKKAFHSQSVKPDKNTWKSFTVFMQTLNVHQDYQVGVIGRISTLPKHGDIILNSTSQSKEKWVSLVLSRADF